jgi:hypothetical protein
MMQRSFRKKRVVSQLAVVVSMSMQWRRKQQNHGMAKKKRKKIDDKTSVQ